MLSRCLSSSAEFVKMQLILGHRGCERGFKMIDFTRLKENNSNNYTTREYKQRLEADLKISMREVVILMCAIFIASLGLNMNSTAVIIGAMLISPLMTPILGIGTGLATYDLALIKKSLLLLATEVVVSLAISFLYFTLTPLREASSEILARTAPTIWDILIAIVGGIAGVIGSRKKEANNIVPGVAIATALMPPICTAGFGLATGNFSYFIGAFYLFLINFVFIMLVTFIGTRVLLQKSDRELVTSIAPKLKRILLAVVFVMVVPSLYSATTLVIEYRQKEALKSYLKQEFSDYTIIDKTLDRGRNVLTLTIVGDPLNDAQVQEKMDHRLDFGLEKYQIQVQQVLGVATNEAKMNELYQTIDKYIAYRLNQSSARSDDFGEDRSEEP